MVGKQAIGDIGMSLYTNMRIRKTTLANLKKLGKMGESYNDVIDRVVEYQINYVEGNQRDE